MSLQQQRDELLPEIIDVLSSIMKDAFAWHGAFDEKDWRFYLVNYSPDEIAAALRIMGPKIRGGYISTSMGDVKRYLSAVLRNQRRGHE